jgi:hypothetical protein
MIPASNIVTINPSVVAAGGSALALNGVVLTLDTAVPINTVKEFVNAADVGAFFGLSSQEAQWAAYYFQGRNNSTMQPGKMMFAQYPQAAVAAYLRGGSLSAMTLAELQAFTGTVIITVNGTLNTSASINLATATSFSDAATKIAAGFTAPNFSVSYDSVRAAFKFISSTTGASSTITFATGTISTGLKLTSATGAVLSQGAIAAVPLTFMSSITALTLNWAAFSTMWQVSNAEGLGFAQWESQQSNRFAYMLWDDAVAALTFPDTTTALALAIAANYGGVIGIYCDPTADPNGYAAAMALGVAASIDFNRTNGRITFAFKYLDGIPVSVTTEANASALEQNGYNFIGQYATANDNFTFFYPGSVTGSYKFADEYLDQVYLNSQLQLALMGLLVAMNSIPYNAVGNSLISAACQDPINQALNFGSIVPGVTLSAAQIAQVNTAAGLVIDGVLSTRGWYLQIGVATPQVRAARGTPPISFWYMDGGSVQRINVASILVQ